MRLAVAHDSLWLLRCFIQPYFLIAVSWMRSTSKLQDREIRWSLKEGIPGKSREVNNFWGAGETELSGRVPPLVFWMVWNKKFSQLPPLLFCYCCCCCRMFWGTFRPSSTGNLQTQDSGHQKFISMIRKSGGVYHFLSVDSYLKFISGNWRNEGSITETC